MASIPASCNPAEHQSVGPDVSGDAPKADAALDLEMTSAVVERGLLMVFGPDGDPLPPGAFGAAAAARPDAGIRIGTDARVPAHRVASVLDAQSTGRLAAGEDEANAWIEAMLGLGPQPTTCTPSELHAEVGACEIMLTGEEIRIGMAEGASLLIGPAHLERSAEARYRLTGPDGAPILLGETLGRLRDEIGEGTGDEGTAPMLPGCSLAWDEQTLVLGAGSISFRLVPAAGASPEETTVDLLSPSREPLVPRDLALAVRASIFDPEQAARVLPEQLGEAPHGDAPAAADDTVLFGLPRRSCSAPTACSISTASLPPSRG